MSNTKVLLIEMRPAFDGFAGIPQETRLLFRGLSSSQLFKTTGLLQTSTRFLPRATRVEREARRYCELISIGTQARRVISIEAPVKRGLLAGVTNYLRKRVVSWRLAIAAIVHGDGPNIGIDKLDSTVFRDYIWSRLFSKTLEAKDFALVTMQDFHTCNVPWNVFQSAGLLGGTLTRRVRYPKIGMPGVDFFIAQTPYPGRVPDSVTMIVRYHDAFPISMPHTIANRARHHDTHFQALLSNVASGAYFSCVSETTRQDLIRLIPEVEPRSVTIHNMLPAFFYREPDFIEDMAALIQRHASTDPRLLPPTRDAILAGGKVRYLLFVSTIEPRKNHATLISAWENYARTVDPELKLVFVGKLGWELTEFLPRLNQHIATKRLFVLSDLSPHDLKSLYRQAEATICPSLAEGFDFSGVESMACGGAVIASDIPVHREIYRDAALYFDTYSSDSLVDALKTLLADPRSPRDALVTQGRKVSMEYHPDRIIPQWEAFLDRLGRTRGA
ncbi:glycosyltransferase family 4 protein [Burkholderia gladioli]|uniref:glycosyltransferase family 4 protein n=1 Tax=Burkholderia gladioli TaxID=28095 RepID=UPI0016422517|nr:glycosyltransferase family 1 protein [Burkholderia gladioli]